MFNIGDLVKVNSKSVGSPLEKSKVARWQGWGYVVKKKTDGTIRVSITPTGRGDRFKSSDLEKLEPLTGYKLVKNFTLNDLYAKVKDTCGIHSGEFARAFTKMYDVIGNSGIYVNADTVMFWAAANDNWRDFLVKNGYLEKKAKYCECCGQKLPE